MNNITIAGALGKNAELKSMPDGAPVLQFSVADSPGREKPTLWWDCSLFGKRAELLQQYLVKGQKVAVSGSVWPREWTAQDGTPRKAFSIRVQDVALQGRPAESRQEAPAPAPRPQRAPTPNPSGFDDMDDDIPY